MSKALQYLSDARPEAMGAYFEFLRANGQSLDPKTRALISVITKVANETEGGLKQYARKALDQGVTRDELLDALMMAFPALGLSKIIWAIDILLDIDALPAVAGASTTEAGDNPGDGPGDESGDDSGDWHIVGALDDFQSATPRLVTVNDRDIFVSKADNGIRVFEAKCPHHESNLSFAPVVRGEIECPMHGWRFRLSDGVCVRGGKDLMEFATRTESGQLLVRW